MAKSIGPFLSSNLLINQRDQACRLGSRIGCMLPPHSTNDMDLHSKNQVR